jgi:hypothetical protein
VIRVAQEHVGQSLDMFLACGRRESECVNYWLADQDATDVCQVVHPTHSGSRGGYAVDGGWLNGFFLDLAERGLRAVAQIHTHPGAELRHSWIDDEFVLVPSPNFVSIVVPDFGQGGPHPETWSVQVLTAAGLWVPDPGAVRWM